MLRRDGEEQEWMRNENLFCFNFLPSFLSSIPRTLTVEVKMVVGVRLELLGRKGRGRLRSDVVQQHYHSANVICGKEKVKTVLRRRLT